MADGSYNENGAGTQRLDGDVGNIHCQISKTTSEQKVSYDVDGAIRRVTVGQMLNAIQAHTTANFTIDGKEALKVVTVANVISMKPNSTWNDFELEDGTGRIKARQFHRDIPDEEKNKIEFSDLAYVRVVGVLSRWQGFNSLVVDHIQQVADAHEPYHHVLHAIVDTLTYERGPPPRESTKTPLRESQGQPNDGRDITEIGQDLPKASPPFLPVSEPNRLPITNLSPAPLSRLRPQPFTPSSIVTAGICSTVSDDPTIEAMDKGKGRPDSTDQGFPSSASRLSTNQRQPHAGSSVSGPLNLSNTVDYDTRSSHRISTKSAHIDISTNYPNAHPTISSISSSEKVTRAHRPRSPAMEPPSSSPTPQSPPSSKHPDPAHSPARRDPYSHLTTLQRDIILCIQNISPISSIYPNEDDGREWEGVHMRVILNAVKTRQRFSLKDFASSIESLLEEGYIYTTIDDAHYNANA